MRIDNLLLKTAFVFCFALAASNTKCLAGSESVCSFDNKQDQEVICIMPAHLASQEEVESISQAHGTVIELIGQGPQAKVHVKTEEQDFIESQREFVNDKRFSETERTCIFMLEEGQSFKAKLIKLAPLL